MRRSAIVLFTMLLAAAIFTAGCSDDSTTPNGTITGDPNSPAFQSMRSAIETTVDSTLYQYFDFATFPDRYQVEPDADTITYIRGELGVTNPADTVLYNYVDGWHILYVGLTTLADYQALYVDSVRFKAMGIVQAHVTEGTDELDLIRHAVSSYDGSESDYLNVNLYANANFMDYNSPDQVINGVGRCVLDQHYLVNQTPVQETFDFDVTVEDLAYDWEQGTPWNEINATGGVITMTGTITGTVSSSTWTITVTFTETGNANISALTGNTTYNYALTPFMQ